MAKQKFVCLYLDYLENWSHYSDAQVGKIVRTMLAYATTGEAPTLKGQERYIWPSVKSQLDRDAEKYTSKCKSNQENGKKGGRPKKQEEPNKSDWFLEEPKKANKNKNENKNEKENEKERGIAHCAPPLDGSLFTRFWEAFPNKLGREKAWEAWKKLNPDKSLAELLISALELWKRSEKWRNKQGDFQFAPRAEAFLSDDGYWKYPPGAPASIWGSGELSPSDIENIRRIMQEPSHRQLDEDEQEAIRRMMNEPDE